MQTSAFPCEAGVQGRVRAPALAGARHEFPSLKKERGHMDGELKELLQRMKRLMPKTAEAVAAKRAEKGAAYVNRCQAESLRGRRGCFYAREGVLALGTPWPEALQSELDVLREVAPAVPPFCIVWGQPEGCDGA